MPRKEPEQRIAARRELRVWPLPRRFGSPAPGFCRHCPSAKSGLARRRGWTKTRFDCRPAVKTGFVSDAGAGSQRSGSRIGAVGFDSIQRWVMPGEFRSRCKDDRAGSGDKAARLWAEHQKVKDRQQKHQQAGNDQPGRKPAALACRQQVGFINWPACRTRLIREKANSCGRDRIVVSHSEVIIPEDVPTGFVQRTSRVVR